MSHLKAFLAICMIIAGFSIAINLEMIEKINNAYASPLPEKGELNTTDENGLPILTPEEKSDWDSFVRAAHKLSPIYDYPVKVLLAQGALESGRGTSKFAKERSNYFGYRCFDGREEEMCAYFENQEQGIIEYMRLIKEHYPEAYQARSNPDRMIELIKEGGYATDSNYVTKVKALPEWRDN